MSNTTSHQRQTTNRRDWQAFGYLLGTASTLILRQAKTWVLMQKHSLQKSPASRDFPEKLYTVPAYVRRKHIPLKKTQH